MLCVIPIFDNSDSSLLEYILQVYTLLSGVLIYALQLSVSSGQCVQGQIWSLAQKCLAFYIKGTGVKEEKYCLNLK